jgi:hypothetical protein
MVHDLPESFGQSSSRGRVSGLEFRFVAWVKTAAPDLPQCCDRTDDGLVMSRGLACQLPAPTLEGERVF